MHISTRTQTEKLSPASAINSFNILLHASRSANLNRLELLVVALSIAKKKYQRFDSCVNISLCVHHPGRNLYKMISQDNVSCTSVQ